MLAQAAVEVDAALHDVFALRHHMHFMQAQPVLPFQVAKSACVLGVGPIEVHLPVETPATRSVGRINLCTMHLTSAKWFA